MVCPSLKETTVVGARIKRDTAAEFQKICEKLGKLRNDVIEDFIYTFTLWHLRGDLNINFFKEYFGEEAIKILANSIANKHEHKYVD